MDSIAKNGREPWISYFTPYISELFLLGYNSASEPEIPLFRSLFMTWQGVFPDESLRIVESVLRRALWMTKGKTSIQNLTIPINMSILATHQQTCMLEKAPLHFDLPQAEPMTEQKFQEKTAEALPPQPAALPNHATNINTNPILNTDPQDLQSVLESLNEQELAALLTDLSQGSTDQNNPLREFEAQQQQFQHLSSLYLKPDALSSLRYPTFDLFTEGVAAELRIPSTVSFPSPDPNADRVVVPSFLALFTLTNRLTSKICHKRFQTREAMTSAERHIQQRNQEMDFTYGGSYRGWFADEESWVDRENDTMFHPNNR
ncbi:hypothetical protein BLNAU_15513 [Blattamonas nauphoetae]|uniref:CID domain-containing protein n=1 Tax=Blattamonas nauphoetae TaxID=2049346 RepID=A0ABQ9XC74_9EUKA|nr:hypothetical protein BLNAU_15513 [Blattamonas nauphoetae]